MSSSPGIKVAESAFVGAVAEALILQDQMLELREKLQQVDERAARANEAALRERGLDENAPPDRIIDAQAAFLTAAVERSGLAEDSQIIRAARGQIEQMRQAYNDALAQEASRVGGFDGPVL